MIVKCLSCGRISYAVTKNHAEQQIKKFNEWLNKQTDETKSNYGGRDSSLYDYKCISCKGQTFKPHTLTDREQGITISPVIYEEEVK